MKLKIVQSLLHGNDEISKQLKTFFKQKKILVFNTISSPGAGKTTFLSSVIYYLSKNYKVAVIVGDIEDTVDGERLSKPNVQVIQLNTKGACHLDANMIKSAIQELNLENLDILIIENVGNLVCPVDFELGEDFKVVILSTTEGDDKPNKYPATFQKAEVIVINKIDLLPYTNFNLEKAERDIKNLSNKSKIFRISAINKETIFEFVKYIEVKLKWKKSQN